MPVLLHAPAFDKQVGETYSGPEEDWLLANGYASREGYDGPGVASTGPLGTSPAKDPTLAVSREPADIDGEDGSVEDYRFKRGKGLSSKVQSDEDDQDYVQKTAGDPDEAILPEGPDFGEVNPSEEAKDVNDQIAAEHAVRAWEADGAPVVRDEDNDEPGDDEDAPEAAESDKTA